MILNFEIICWTSCDSIQTFFTIVIALIPYVILFVILRPNLKITYEGIDNNINRRKIKIKLKNIGQFTAVNIRIEICAVETTTKKDIFTYHFKTDQNDFLILPKKGNERDFKVVGLSESAQEYINGVNEIEKYNNLLSYLENNSQYKLRIRIHSYNSASGLGKAEEAIFDLNKTNP